MIIYAQKKYREYHRNRKKRDEHDSSFASAPRNHPRKIYAPEAIHATKKKARGPVNTSCLRFLALYSESYERPGSWRRDISKLAHSEKAPLLCWASSDLSDEFPDTGVYGGEPSIVRTRIPIWVLKQARGLGISEAELLRSYPTMHAEDP